MNDISELIRELPDRNFMARCFAELHAKLGVVHAPPKPTRPRHRASIAPRTWHSGRVRAA